MGLLLEHGLQRRRLLQMLAAASVPGALPLAAHGELRRFEPQPGAWREFELTTSVEVRAPQGATTVWLPVPSIDSDYQRSLESTWSSNARDARLVSDSHYGARMLQVAFDANEPAPRAQLTSRVRTQNRATDWQTRSPGSESADVLRAWTQPTALMPTDGIVKQTALKITRGARGDEAKVRAVYDWVVDNTWREPKVRGCGVGDIASMLETENFGGKCADLNALFVGLCRAAGVPARDVYGIRLVPSAFGYKELGGNPAKLQGAQHCRAEVYLQQHGWVAMDPADVAKVMRQEAPEWIKNSSDPLVAPVRRALFGGWEGNWLGFNTAHDVALPGSKGPKLGFLMYPQAESAEGRRDSLDPDSFKYTISARELTT